MRHTLVSFIFVLVFFSLNAQKNFTFGLSTSLDFNSYSTVESSSTISYKGKIGFSAGPVFKSVLTESIFLSYGILYSMKNYKINIEGGLFRPIDEGDPIVVEDEELSFSNSFIDIPIDLGFNLKQYKQTQLYGITGFVNSFQIGHTNEHIPNVGGDQDAKTYKNYLFSLKLGLGLMIKKEKYCFSLEPQTRFYLSKVHQEFPTEKPFQFGLQLQIMKI